MCPQVIAGGNYDVDCFVTDPLHNVLYHERKKQYDSFSHTTAMGGAYQVCFSNEFSTFSHKIVYLDIRTGDERPLLPVMNSATALTQVSKYIHQVLWLVLNCTTSIHITRLLWLVVGVIHITINKYIYWYRLNSYKKYLVSTAGLNIFG